MPVLKEDEFQGLFQEAIRRGASDIHLTAGMPPLFRIDGDLAFGAERNLENSEIAYMFRGLTTAEQQAKLKAAGEVDFSCWMQNYGYFRGNACLCRGEIAIALRLLASRAPTLEELGHTRIVAELSLKKRGLVLVTGPTGAGKSTTAAAMIELMSRTRACHIITLEDPVEFVYSSSRSIIHQREVGRDTESFTTGLRAALREDPDVIFVGELRDAETIAVALRAALTGHLVLATLHTFNTPQAVERVINAFQPSQQGQVKLQLAMVLQGVISQQLLKRKNGAGRVAATEIMTATPAVRNLIREGKTHQLLSCIQAGGKFGMQTMGKSLEALWAKGFISQEDAAQSSFYQENF